MKKTLNPYAASAALALSLAMPASADIFLDYDGIDGSSEDAEFANKIDVLAWSWGLSNSGTTHQGAANFSSVANFQDISITKYNDKASVQLYKHIATGKFTPSATLSVTKPPVGPGGKHFIYAEIELNNIIVSSASTSATDALDGPPTENITLNFSYFKITNTEQNLDGSKGDVTEFCYDIAAGKAGC